MSVCGHKEARRSTEDGSILRGGEENRWKESNRDTEDDRITCKNTHVAAELFTCVAVDVCVCGVVRIAA